ncbi:hypothetical protein V0R50_03325 [Pseudomonas sp. 148P]|uniref:Uncharacterized protein n=1 Tax=Pseudomonas ulcerans TaxID=3115852 RepID=A0ABU7HL28_9PSED|nr:MULTISPECIES: hypothetical protein [unclassified Pseudomonas]MEE1920857.1 hypothetical protein [Pseudomonas sp. 147P]MEE1932242.1 hypothetical protein [Pseudomonas sp. 148P]
MQEATHKALELAYQAILSDEAIARLEQVKTDREGVFLSSASANPVNLMIVGRETTSWFGGSRKTHITPGEEYLTASAKGHWQSAGQLAGSSKFRQLYRKAEKDMEPIGCSVSWHSPFAISYTKNYPVRYGEFENIAKLSRKLLSAQIEILKPKATLLALEPNHDIYTENFFQGRLTKIKAYERRKLWGFGIDGAPCFRTIHPRHAQGELSPINSLELPLENTTSTKNKDKT